MNNISDMICESFYKHSEKIAVKTLNKVYSYSELEKLTITYINIINEITDKKRLVIGVYMSRSIHNIALLIAILRTGSSFLVLDKEFPLSRLMKIIDISCLEVIITDSGSNDFNGIDNVRVYSLMDINYQSFSADKVHMDLPIILPDDKAYTLFTSGSTGLPKGVCISHEALAVFTEGFLKAIPFKNYETILALTNTAFDISILEILAPLTIGMTIILATDRDKIHPKYTIKFIKELEPQIVQLTPSYLTYLQAYRNDKEWMNNIKVVILGGEKITSKHMQAFESKPNILIYNAYGPTEATIWFSVGELTDSTSIHSGKPIDKMDYRIVDKDMQDSEVGELLLTGPCLSLGYINNDSATKEKFIKLDSKRFYRTGDLARKDINNNLEIIGRCDNQIKVLGHRIELEDIEENIIRLTSIESCVVVYRNNSLCCYYQSGESEDDIISIRDILKKELPLYMIPKSFFKLHKMPLTLNGKVDRKMLNNSKHDDILEKEIVDFITEYIVRPLIFDASLADNGFDSIEIVTLMVTIEEKYSIEFDDDAIMMDFYKNMNEFIKYTIKLIGE